MQLHGTVLLLVSVAYGVLSLFTFLVYAYDKQAARKGEPRIAERHLHLLDLIGGWPGGWLAQKVLRHKCSKPAFQRWYWLTVLINLAVLGGIAASVASTVK